MDYSWLGNFIFEIYCFIYNKKFPKTLNIFFLSMVSMVLKKNIFTCIFICLLFSSCKVDSVVYLNGGKGAVNAEVFIDGKKFGKMKKIGDGSELTIEIPPGDHLLKVINEKSQVFEQGFYVKGETYIGIEFKEQKK